MNCKQIIAQHLRENGYDGLYWSCECACKIDDLMPCDRNIDECRPGYLADGDDEFDFYIVPEKPDG